MTLRESQIAYSLLRGAVAREISEDLFLSKRTVEKHIENLKSRFMVKSKASLVRVLFQRGFAFCRPVGIDEMKINQR